MSNINASMEALNGPDDLDLPSCKSKKKSAESIANEYLVASGLYDGTIRDLSEQGALTGRQSLQSIYR